MTGLDSWLKQATRHLANEPAVQVRTEIQQHYESARDAAITEGATADEADRSALKALGDAKSANRQYRRVLLTSAEAKILREADFTGCCRPWVKWLLLTVPVGFMTVAGALFLTGHAAIARDLLVGGMGISPWLAAPLMPVYTPSRGRIIRSVKWIALAGALVLVWGPEAFNWSWLWITCLWPIVSAEWTRASIRRKLPIAAWPKHLYL